MMHLLISEIFRNPSSVNKNALFFTLFIQVSVEWSYNFNTFLSVFHLLNLDLLIVIKDASDLNLFEGKFILELIDVLACPQKVLAIQWSDVKCLLTQKFCSKIIILNQYDLWSIRNLPSLSLVGLILSASFLIFHCLLHEY
jgi:hypothetical protein